MVLFRRFANAQKALRTRIAQDVRQRVCTKLFDVPRIAAPGIIFIFLVFSEMTKINSARCAAVRRDIYSM